MVRIAKELFRRKDCPKWAKYVFSDSGELCFSEEHPDIMLVPGIEMCWQPAKFGKHKKIKERVCGDYIERLIMCRNRKNDFPSHEEEINRMKEIDRMFEN